MALHDSLRELVSVRGAGVVDEAEEFRGALDDFLAEDEATLGELNLLVDAVRLGALRRVLEVMDHGADPEAAVREAGASLARDRGTDDPTRSCWALAVLAFSLGKVDGSMVRKFRGDAGTMSAPDAPRSPLPPPVISGTGTAERPNTQVLGGQHSVPTSAQVPAAAPQPVSVQPPPPTVDVHAPPPYVGPVPPVIPEERSSRAGIFLLVVLLALILGGLVAAGLILLGDDDPTASDDPTPGGDGTGGGSQAEPLVPRSAMLVPFDDGGVARIYQVDVLTGEFEELTNGPRDALPSLTPDRRTMTFQEGPAPFVTHVVDLASNDQRPLFDSAGPCSHSGRPAWSPDGSRMAVLCTGEDKDPDGIWLADAEGTLEPEPIVDSPLVQGSPTWVSPTRFVYGAREDENEESAVSFWSIDVDEQVPTPLDIDIDSTLHLSHVDWSEEAGKLLFLASPSATDEAGDIWTMDVDGSNATMLADGDFAHPVWSPDGDAIGVTSFESGTEVLAYIPVDDSEDPDPVVIPNPPPGDVGIPVWGTR